MKISGHRYEVTNSVFERYNIIDEADLAEAAQKLDERQKSNALSFEQLERQNGHSLGMIVEKGTKTEAVAHLNSTTAVLPN